MFFSNKCHQFLNLSGVINRRSKYIAVGCGTTIHTLRERKVGGYRAVSRTISIPLNISPSHKFPEHVIQAISTANRWLFMQRINRMQDRDRHTTVDNNRTNLVHHIQVSDYLFVDTLLLMRCLSLMVWLICIYVSMKIEKFLLDFSSCFSFINMDTFKRAIKSKVFVAFIAYAK